MIELQESTKINTGKILDGFSRMFKRNQEENSVMEETEQPSPKILGNIYNLMVRIENGKELDYLRKQKTQSLIEEQEEERHKQIMRAFSLKRFVAKKEEIKEKPKTKKGQGGKKPKDAAGKKGSVPKTTEPAPAPQAPAPAPVPKPAAQTTPAPAAPAPTPKTATPVTPKTTTAPPPIIPKTAAPTAEKIVGGGLLAAASLSVRGETGAKDLKTVSTDVKKVGQVVDNDPKPGVKSYGVFGINSQGSVQTFVADNPQFNLIGKPGSKEFDDSWKSVAAEKTKEFYEAQIKWYEKYVYGPLKKDMKKLLPSELASNDKVLTYMADRRNQVGKIMEESAIRYSISAKTPEEFITKIAEHDISDENIRKIFPTYLKTHGESRIKGLQNRVELRKKFSLEVQPLSGQTIDNTSRENTDIRKDLSQTQPMQQVINNLQVSQTQTAGEYRNEKVNDNPAYIEKRFNG